MEGGVSRFARVRVGVGHNQLVPELLEQEWLLIEWPEGEAEPTKYWFSTLPASMSFRQLVDFAKLRWRIERDYQELKQEVGLGHYEGRGWRGFHHHATLCVPPRCSRRLPYPKVIDAEAPPLWPERHIPELDRNYALNPRADKNNPAMSPLRRAKIMTQ